MSNNRVKIFSRLTDQSQLEDDVNNWLKSATHNIAIRDIKFSTAIQSDTDDTMGSELYSALIHYYYTSPAPYPD